MTTKHIPFTQLQVVQLRSSLAEHKRLMFGYTVMLMVLTTVMITVCVDARNKYQQMTNQCTQPVTTDYYYENP